jgi:heat shock protein HslJ
MRTLGDQGHRRLAGALLVTLLTACGGINAGGSVAIDGDWRLSSGTGPEGGIDPPDGHPVTLRIESDEVDGTAACNGYGGRLADDGEQLRVEELYSTEMACEPEEAMTAEAAYLAALVEVDSATVDGDTLILSGEDTQLIFRPADA